MKFSYSKIAKGLVVEPNCTEEWLQNIIDIGFDYDGCETVKGLKDLIDELVDCAICGLSCLKNDKIFEDSAKTIKEEEESRLKALAEKAKDDN